MQASQPRMLLAMMSSRLSGSRVTRLATTVWYKALRCTILHVVLAALCQSSERLSTLVLMQSDATYLIVTENNEIEKYGLNAVCTHLGCVVPWNSVSSRFLSMPYSSCELQLARQWDTQMCINVCSLCLIAIAFSCFVIYGTLLVLSLAL